MTTFKDVLYPLLGHLDDLSTESSKAIAYYTDGPDGINQFKTYVFDHIDGVTGSLPFLGKGAQGCKDAVNRNASRAHYVITKLQDFQLASDQTRKSLEDICPPYDDESRYRLGVHEMIGDPWAGGDPVYATSVSDYFYRAQGYSEHDEFERLDFGSLSHTIIWRIREDTLPGLNSRYDDLLKPGIGQGVMDDSINYAVTCIKSDFQNYQAQRHSDLLHSKELNADEVKMFGKEIDDIFNQAMLYVTTIANKMKEAYGEWVTEFQVIVGQYQVDISTASQISSPSIGDLITDVTAPGMTGKVYVWRTANGLVVIVKPGTSAAEVEAAIQQYTSDNVAITLIGYQDGGKTAQDMVRDESGKNYTVTNLILVGSEPENNLPGHLNVSSYTAPTKETTKAEETILGLKPDQIVIPIAAVALAFLTDGLGDAALLTALKEGGQDIGKELLLAEIWNHTYGAPKGEDTPKKLAAALGPQFSIDLGDGNGLHSGPDVAFFVSEALDGKYPNAKIYISQDRVLPPESGANLNNFTNSSYLNSQIVPDPGSLKHQHAGAFPLDTGN